MGMKPRGWGFQGESPGAARPMRLEFKQRSRKEVCILARSLLVVEQDSSPRSREAGRKEEEEPGASRKMLRVREMAQ